MLSPGDRSRDVLDKVGEYLQAGVRLVWVIDPTTRRAHIYRPDSGIILTSKDDLDGEAVIPGFRCPINDLFVPPTA